MKVKFFGVLEEYAELDLDVCTLREVLSMAKLTYGHEFTDKLVTGNFYYALANSLKADDVVLLTPEICFSEFPNYDILYVLPEIEGEVPVPMIAAMLEVAMTTAEGAAIWSAETVAVYALTAAINIGLTMAIGMLSQAVAPTTVFSGDPAYMQNRLFNGSPIIREQGGSVPLVFGNPFGGGVLISSGISTGSL